jgi:hypothetical protein
LGRLFQVQCGEHVGLLGVDGGDAADRGCGIDADAVVLNSPQLCQRLFGVDLFSLSKVTVGDRALA